MAKRRHSLARRHHLGAASKGSSTRWLIGAGIAAVAVAGLWYWRSNLRKEAAVAANAPLIAKIRCTLLAIETPGTALASSPGHDVARVRLIGVLNQLTAGIASEQVTLPDVSAADLRVALAEIQSKPCPSLDVVLA